MSDSHTYLALDLGAESGRGELVTLADGKVTLAEVHRWPNRPVQLGGTLHWDLPFLFAEIVEAIAAAGRTAANIEGISVDTWGVDFGLLGANDELLGLPVNYRDARTQGIHEYSNPTMDVSEIFQKTAYEPWPIASLFQLLALQRDGSALLPAAEAFLNMPDLLGFYLTGRKASEKSIANTTNLMGTDGRWCQEIVGRFNLPGEMLCELVEPATVLGPLRAELAEATGVGEVPVIATCGHDTSAAVAAIPAEGENWAFLSSGTWSILGSLVDEPVPTPRCLELGFTNEYTIGGWYLARNISGLWMVQQLRKKWNTPAEPVDYPGMTAWAAEAETEAFFDAADESLLAPADMEEAVTALIAKAGGPAPTGRGQVVRAVLQSLALEYNRRLDALGELTGQRPECIYMVGGGIANELLCQLTADACGVPLHAGADQCTAMGNALGQALALGVLSDRQDIREVMRASFPPKTYTPRDEQAWAPRRQRYAERVS